MRKLFATAALVVAVMMSSCSNDDAFETETNTPIAELTKKTLKFSYKDKTYQSNYITSNENNLVFDDADVQAMYDQLTSNENLAGFLNEDGSLVYYDNIDALNEAYSFTDEEVVEDESVEDLTLTTRNVLPTKGYCTIFFFQDFPDGHFMRALAGHFKLSYAKPSNISLQWVDWLDINNYGTQLPARITVYTGTNYTGQRIVYAAKPNGGIVHAQLHGAMRYVRSYSCCFYYP